MKYLLHKKYQYLIRVRHMNPLLSESVRHSKATLLINKNNGVQTEKHWKLLIKLEKDGISRKRDKKISSFF